MPLILPLTTLENISYCRYLTDQNTRTRKHWDARNIVRAIKGDSFNGYADLMIGGQTMRLDHAHSELAFTWFAEFAAATTEFRSTSPIYLVPIPHSSCTVAANEQPKVLKLALALKAKKPTLLVADLLRFKQPMPKSSETNMRDENVLYQALQVATVLPKNGSFILLDDVCTSGAHAKAAARALRAAGGQVDCAMSVARTTHDPSLSIFGFLKESL